MEPEPAAIAASLVAAGVITADAGAVLREAEHASVEDLAAVKAALAAAARRLEGPAGESDESFEALVFAVDAAKAVDAEFRKRAADAAERHRTVAKLAASLVVDGKPAEQPRRLRPASIAQLAASSRRTGRQPSRLRHGPRILTASGEPTDSDLIEVFSRGLAREHRAMQAQGPAAGPGRALLATLQIELPEERMLGRDEVENQRRVDAVTSPAALAASGGVCGPVAADFSVDGVSVDDRPVRDTAMSRFGATRGGVRYKLPHTLASVHADGPSSLWTEATDAAPGGSTKPHATYVCGNVQEAYVDAVTSIIEFGNWAGRYDPEAVADYIGTATADHARLAEATLLAVISAGSVHTFGDENLLGAVSDLLAIVDRGAAAIRYRNRMAAEAPLRILFPEWLEDELRADLARELPGNSGGQSERLAVADAEMARWWSVRNLNVTKYLDNPTGASTLQGFGAQGAGPLLPWPTKAQVFLYPEGSWQFLDGGTLDLGMVRDSTLNATNSLQVWSESFEKAVFRGVESLEILADVCASGARASVQDSTSICVSGS